MGLLTKERNLNLIEYYHIWDIVDMLSKDGLHSWEEVGQFLGHYNFDTELTLYQEDGYCRINELHNNYLPIRKLIDGLTTVWLNGEESIPNIKFDIVSYYWSKHEIYNFKPIMDLGIIEKPPTQVGTFPSVQESQPDNYKFFLYKQSLFNFVESACIISDYDPLDIQKCPLEDIDEVVPDYSRAYSLISSAVESGKLNVFNYKIDANDFRNYLASENIIITGFNDQIAEPLYTDSTKAHVELKKIIANLKLDLAIEKTNVQDLNKEIDHLKVKIAKLQALQVGQEDCLFSQIFDESATERYAPDLANSIKLWQSLYIENKLAEDKHSNRANHWILKNTPYKDIASVEVKRLREITSPFDSWHVDRKNKFNK